MTAGFAVTAAAGDRFTVLALSGELDLAEAPTLRKAIDEHVGPDTSLLVADARDLNFIDSTGIGVLVATRNQLARTGGLLVIANLGQTVGRPLQVTEVDTAIPVHWAGELALAPWTEPGATPASILTALGFEAEAAAFGTGPGVGAEPVS
jgi:anti-sigma B factor antagonist